MSKLTTAEDKLLKRGFDWATDSNGYDPSSDEMDVLKYLNQNPGETVATKIARAINIPVHRVIAARNRLETAGKLPTVQLDNVIDFRPEQSDLPIVETCSTGNNETVEPVTNCEQVTVITLWQPWATFIVKGIKCFETRSWATNHKGRILIHAAARKLNWLEIPLTALRKYLPDINEWDYPTGAIVGEASLINCHRVEAIRDNLDGLEKLCGDYSDDRFAWELTNIKPLFIPNVKGKQGLWKYELTVNDDVVLGETVEAVEPKTNCETQNREQENILLTDPPRQVEVNGQLSIFFDDCSEPPDPDDFETGDEYEEAYDKWATLYPEIERAINQAKVREFQNTHWSNGDYVQLISDPRRIGQLIGIKNGGLYKIKFADGFATELKADAFLDQPFCKENSEVVLGESFFKVGEFVVTSAPGFEDKIFKVEKIYHTGMIGVIDKSNQSFSFPANWLNHYVEKVGKSKGKILENSERKRPAKGCGSGSLVTRQANKKRNAAKGRDPDIYYVYCYSYTDNYGKEIKSSISVPREKIAYVKGMIERKEHYVKIAKFLGKSLPVYY